MIRKLRCPLLILSLWLCMQAPSSFICCVCSWDPPPLQQLHEFLHSSSVKCPAKTKAVQQRTKQRGISIPLLSSHAHPHYVTLDIIKHSPSVTRNTTKHSAGAVLLKQTLCWNPRGRGEWRRSWGDGCEGGQELMVFMLNSQRVGNARNTIPMFSLPQLIRQNDRGSRFPYRESCHLDIYPR